MTDRQYFFRMFRYVKPFAAMYVIGTFVYTSQLFFGNLIYSIFYGGVTAAIVNLSFSEVRDTIWLMVIIVLAYMIPFGFGTYLYIVTITYARRDISIDTFSAFMKSNVENQKHSGEGIAAINTDIDTAMGILDDALTPFLMNAIGAGFSAVAVAVIDWRMGLGALVVGILAFFIQLRFAAPLAKLGKAQLEVNADSVKSLSNIFAGALTIRAFNRQERSLLQFDRESGKLKKLAFRQAFLGMWKDLVTTVQGWLTLILVFAFGGMLVIRGEMDFAQIMMVLPLAGAVGSSMSQIGATFADLQPPIVAAKRIFAIIDSAQEAREIEPVKTGDITGNISKKYDIKVDKLSFSYKDADKEAVKDTDLLIGEKKMIAFVGESGSGKSTLLRVIIGMYEQDGLNMEIGGIPFTADSVKEWRNHFAFVDQSCKLFDMSISENIAMGKQGDANDSEIKEAAKRAYAHDFITELPDGYDTSCGEKGASLSGGQKQRIAIARALCRKAPVLVFDEATSALDTETERGIMETIEELRKDHTILITTHNLSNITTADKIVVMDEGRIAESGIHTELVEKGGLYSKLLKKTQTV